VAKSRRLAGNDLHPRQAVKACQDSERAARTERDAGLTEPWTAWTRRAVGTDIYQGFTDILNPPATRPPSPFLGHESILSPGMRTLIRLITSITSPVFFEDRVSMVFAPCSNRMRIDFNVCRRIVFMAPANRCG
jgi:hypothetical protein